MGIDATAAGADATAAEADAEPVARINLDGAIRYRRHSTGSMAEQEPGLTTVERIRLRAYFHYVNRTGWNWRDPVSNWAQAEREERAALGHPLDTDQYRIRLPFRLLPGQSIDDLDGLIAFKQGEVEVTLRRQGSLYILEARTFQTETAAEHFYYKLLGALTWLAFDLHLPIVRAPSLSTVMLRPDAGVAARNLSRGFGLTIDPPLDGLLNAEDSVVLPDWAVVRFASAGSVSVHASSAADRVVSSLSGGLRATDISVVLFDERLCLAIDIYLSHYAESSSQARLLTLVMALEALTGGEQKHVAAQALLDRWKAELDAERYKYDAGTAESDSIKYLDNELFFRRNASISSQVKNVVRRALEAEGSSETEIKESLRATSIVYDARSRLTHEGHLPSADVGRAYNLALPLVQRVLKSRLSHQDR